MLSLLLLGFVATNADKIYSEGFDPNGTPPAGMNPNCMIGSDEMEDSYLSDCDAAAPSAGQDFRGYYVKDKNLAFLQAQLNNCNNVIAGYGAHQNAMMYHQAMMMKPQLEHMINVLTNSPDVYLRVEQCGDRMLFTRNSPNKPNKWRVYDFTIGGGLAQGGYDVDEACNVIETKWDWSGNKLTIDPKVDFAPIAMLCQIALPAMGSTFGKTVSWEKLPNGNLLRTAQSPMCMYPLFGGQPEPPMMFTKLSGCDVTDDLCDCNAVNHPDCDSDSTGRRLMKEQMA